MKAGGEWIKSKRVRESLQAPVRAQYMLRRRRLSCSSPWASLKEHRAAAGAADDNGGRLTRRAA
jgi:hypothetical protein